MKSENNIELFGYSAYHFDENSYLRKMDFHNHNSIEISYVGMGELLFDYVDKNGDTKSFSLYKNQIAITKPFVTHKTTVSVGLESYGLEFVSQKDLKIAMNELMQEEAINIDSLFDSFDDIIVLQDTVNIKDTIKQFKSYVNNDGKYVDSLLKIEIKKLILQILLCSEKNNIRKESNKHINDAIVYIKQFFNRDLKSSDVATHVKLSEVYFQKLFKQCTGMKFNKYLNTQRINYALDLIKSTNYSLSKIATMSGYNSLQIFNRNFVMITGQTPKEYQQAFLSQHTNQKINETYYQEKKYHDGEMGVASL